LFDTQIDGMHHESSRIFSELRDLFVPGEAA